MSAIDIIYDLFNKWRRVEIIHISPLQAIEKEPIYIKLKNEGYAFCWPDKTKRRKKEAEGWKVVSKKHLIQQNKVFMDKNEELLLFCRKIEETKPK
jgi:hypothetical protein